jgi:hypothetical protein
MIAVRLQALHRAPPPTPQQPTMSAVKPGGPSASGKPRQESCVRSSGIITLSAPWLVKVWDEARLRRGHNDQSRRGHECSETTLTGESQFHISIPLGIEPGSLMTGTNRWTTGPVELCMNAVRLQALDNTAKS